jgi:hypothetical protein
MVLEVVIGFFEDKVAVFYFIEAAVEIRTHYLSKHDQHLV